MAKNFSNLEVIKAQRNAYGSFFPLNNDTFFLKFVRKILIQFYKSKWTIFNFKQTLLKLIFIFLNKKNNKPSDIKFNISSLDSNNKIISEKLKHQGYVFIENFFDEETYNSLKNYFPEFYNFKHSMNPLKNYFSSYSFVKDKRMNIPSKSSNFTYNRLFEFIKSTKFENLFNSFINSDKEYILHSFMLTYKKENSYLIPHQDGTINLKFDNYNFIYFLDGNNRDIFFSAGTGIFKDNEFKKPLMLPTNLKNSCIIYNTSNLNDFYHGFDIVKKNCFAKVFTIEMSNKEL